MKFQLIFKEKWIIGLLAVMFAKPFVPGIVLLLPISEPTFNPPPELLSLSKNEWEEMTQEVFSIIFKNSAFKPKKY